MQMIMSDFLRPKSNIGKLEFLIRSFTWGLPCTVGGMIIAFGMLLTGHRPRRFGCCIQFEIGRNWGGGSLGICMFTCKNASFRLKAHEHGHSIQNCFYGPLMPLLVNIPSSTRYLYRKIIKQIFPKLKIPPYDSAWFEAEATKLGVEFMNNFSEIDFSHRLCSGIQSTLPHYVISFSNFQRQRSRFHRH